jgi:predicted nucleotidyltransferase
MIIQELAQQKLIHPPKFVPDNTHLLVQMGSIAYGVSTDSSDIDVNGFCIPHADDVFPHLAGDIIGFGRQKQRFESWSEHHITDPRTKKEYDFTVFSIVKFFQLCMDNNPNMVDTLFVPLRCVMHQSKVGIYVRENRHLFLHKGSFHKFVGYAYSQFKKMRDKKTALNPKRQASIDQFGYDVKFGYHIVRLALEAQQILETGDLDLERNASILKSIREGEWTLERLEEWFAAKEITLEGLYDKSTLRDRPDEEAIKEVLLNCLEMHFGDLGKMSVKRQHSSDLLVREIAEVLSRHK